MKISGTISSKRSRRRLTGKFLALVAFALIISFWRITTGEWEIPFECVIHFLSANLGESERILPQALVIRNVRLPRLICSFGTGGLLSVSGVILQGLLANPMAEPYTLGIAAGAAFGASLGIIFGNGNFLVMPCAFAGAVFALIFTGIIALRGGNFSNSKIILAGIISNSILSAGVTLLKSISGEKIGSIVLWLMGSFSGAGVREIFYVAFAVVITIFPAIILSSQLDAMSLGNNRGAILGVNENLVRIILLVTNSLGVAVIVSSFGLIGFVGLIIPHVMRILVGASHLRLIIFAFMSGACLLSFADGVAQSIGELPVGVLTALLGGIFFCWLLARNNNA